MLAEHVLGRGRTSPFRTGGTGGPQAAAEARFSMILLAPSVVSGVHTSVVIGYHCLQ